LREKRTSIAAVRAKLGQFDIFQTPLLSGCRLPLKEEENSSKISRHREQLLAIRNLIANSAHSSVCVHLYYMQLLAIVLRVNLEAVSNSAENFLNTE
jgi:hypothetical protein